MADLHPIRAFRAASRGARGAATRTALGLLGTALVSARRRGLVRVHDHGGIWEHRHPGVVLFFPEITAVSPVVLDAQATEIFGWDHAPDPGEIVLDVGAGVGEEARWFSRRVGPTGRVVAIEAHPRTFRCLEAMVAANGLVNVVPVHLAASDAEGELAIEDGAESLGNSVVAGAGAIRVPATTLDAVAAARGLDRVDLLKLNIEGAEVAALRGAAGLLARTRHVVVSCHDFKADRGGEASYRTKAAVRELLQAAGFALRERPDHTHPWVRDTVYGRRG